MPKSKPVEEVDDVEIVEAELDTGDTPRTIRVYDSKGDFVITVPAGCRLTFGYFNPGKPERDDQHWGRTDQMRRTALRIYQGSGNGNQLACFTGVAGFRDESITLTRLRERIVVERTFDDDGEGTVKFGGHERREIVAAPEPDTYN